ncbi:SAM-dependent methyltransferase [Candidatus Entotheonella palauensis]|uniref:SAM-dependent methyltransferase n=1 Tax=Candidatus Entotheonella palauensis TaxID=93172 RepID=UPI0015C46C08|nr:class I SAM-dependent methyltransferase [Candidatus Entotheonella palauensis]
MADIIRWDMVNWSQALRYWERGTTIDLTTCRALELGAGRSGGLSLWLALQGAEVVCSTLGEVPSQVRDTHRAYGVDAQITYESIDMRSIPYEDAFDVIVFKSVLGTVEGGAEQRRAAIAQIDRALRPGGELLFAENLAATSLHMALRQRFGEAKFGWHYMTIADMTCLLARFSSMRYITTGVVGALGRTSWQRNVLGRIDQWLLNALLPEAWRYIMIGIATAAKS